MPYGARTSPPVTARTPATRSAGSGAPASMTRPIGAVPAAGGGHDPTGRGGGEPGHGDRAPGPVAAASSSNPRAEGSVDGEVGADAGHLQRRRQQHEGAERGGEGVARVHAEQRADHVALGGEGAVGVADRLGRAGGAGGVHDGGDVVGPQADWGTSPAPTPGSTRRPGADGPGEAPERGGGRRGRTAGRAARASGGGGADGPTSGRRPGAGAGAGADRPRRRPPPGRRRPSTRPPPPPAGRSSAAPAATPGRRGGARRPGAPGRPPRNGRRGRPRRATPSGPS